MQGSRAAAREALRPIDESAVAAFAAGFRGALFTPDDEGYDDARRVWNGLVDRYPAVVARPAGTADVVRAGR